MALLDIIGHLLNFVAPALVVGALLAVLARIFMKKVPRAPGLLAQLAINCVAGVLVLGIGLWFFGSDGKMASYAVMVLAIASAQWWPVRRH